MNFCPVNLSHTVVSQRNILDSIIHLRLLKSLPYITL
jgi:hypothetical protein